MAISPDDVYDYLEHYDIDESIVSENWIAARIADTIDPFLEDKLGITTTKTYNTIIEWAAGTDTNMLMLNYRPVISVDYVRRISIGGDTEYYDGELSYNIDKDKGIIYSNRIFSKNRKYIKDWEIKYTYGFSELIDPIKQACVMLLAELVLGQIASQTGGGNINVQGVGRQYGRRGIYSDARDELIRRAFQILRRYMSGVVS